MFPQFRVFPEIALHFSSFYYEDFPDFPFRSSVLRISHSLPSLSAAAMVQFAETQLYHVTSLRPIAHVGIFPPL
jgi:hypothetical protein